MIFKAYLLAPKCEPVPEYERYESAPQVGEITGASRVCSPVIQRPTHSDKYQAINYII